MKRAGTPSLKAQIADPATAGGSEGGSSPWQVPLGHTRPGLANHKRKSRGAGTLPLIRFTL